MKKLTRATVCVMMSLLLVGFVYAQGITEYGRGLGGVTQRRGAVTPKAPRGSNFGGKAQGVTGTLGNLGVNPVPSALTVESEDAALYNRSDAGGEKIAGLSLGEKLTPLAQTVGGSLVWYMVKTEKGVVGWVKSSDVRKEVGEKQ